MNGVYNEPINFVFSYFYALDLHGDTVDEDHRAQHVFCYDKLFSLLLCSGIPDAFVAQ